MRKASIAAGAFVINAMTVIGFYIAFKSVKEAIIWSAPILIGSLLVIIISLLLQLNRLKIEIKSKEEELSELKTRHDTLSKEFNKKRKKLDNTRVLWQNLDIVFLNAIQGSKEERFEQAHNLYLQYTYFIDNYEEEE